MCKQRSQFSRRMLRRVCTSPRSITSSSFSTSFIGWWHRCRCCRCCRRCCCVAPPLFPSVTLLSLSLSLSRGDYSSSIREMNRLDSRCANLSDTVRASFSFSTLNCRPGYEAGFVNSCSVWIPKIINLPRFEN